MNDEIVFICQHCKEGFALEDAKRVYEDDQPVTACPNCRSTNLEEAKRCKACQGIYYEHQFHGKWCDNCFDRAIEAWRESINYLHPWVRECLTFNFGNIDITQE